MLYIFCCAVGFAALVLLFLLALEYLTRQEKKLDEIEKKRQRLLTLDGIVVSLSDFIVALSAITGEKIETFNDKAAAMLYNKYLLEVDFFQGEVAVRESFAAVKKWGRLYPYTAAKEGRRHFIDIRTLGCSWQDVIRRKRL